MKQRFTVRGDIRGDDTSDSVGAVRFAFDITPETWLRLKQLRCLLYTADQQYGLDLYSVTYMGTGMLCGIYGGRRTNECRNVECRELVVTKDVFYWQFGLGDRETYQTAETYFADVEKKTEGWDK